MRMIDADNVILLWNKYHYSIATHVIEYDEELRKLPTVELIRCKDCKYYRIYKHPDWTVELCGRFRTTMADPVKEDDYCSKAERKDK